MKHLFVPYEMALKLKEKGFNEPCLALFNNSDKPIIAGNTPVFNSKTVDDSIICAPTHQQVQDWFETHGVSVETFLTMMGGWRFDLKPIDSKGTRLFQKNGLEIMQGGKIPADFNETFDTKYQALNKAIEEALTLI